MKLERSRVVRAENDTYYNEDGSHHIDMFAANGTVVLGHGNESVVSVVRKQVELAWNTGILETPIRAEAKAILESFFPATHALATFYTTGMEAAEFAIRLSRVTTKRKGIIGFAKSMHGKSMATAFLAWENPYIPELPDFYRLSFPSADNEEQIIKQLEDILCKEETAAVFIEPLQGSNGGQSASPRFYNEAYRLCKQYGTLLVFDEILTGFYRTGPAFFHTNIGFMPDVVLVGKAVGNGFPVSGVIADKKYTIEPAMLPGSTYAGNPLASASVVGTLGTMRALPLTDMVKSIESQITSTFATIHECGAILRGKGALWVLELPTATDAFTAANAIYKRGVLVIQAGPFVRMLPAVTIDPKKLEMACTIIAEEVRRQLEPK